MKKHILVSGLTATMFIQSNLLAQGFEASADANAEGDLDGGVDSDASVETTEPAPEPEPTPAPVVDDGEVAADEPAAGGTDHDKVIGHFGVGYMGRQTMTIGAARTQVAAPIIGVRYWLTDFIGIDGGLGLNISGGRNTTTAAGVDNVKKPGLTVFMIHAGVPLNLFSRGSFSFQVVPELNIGFAGTGNQDPDPDEILKDSGFHLSVGGRAGAEIQFGFIGIPELSLQGNVGLYVQHESGRTRTEDAAGNELKVGDSSTTFGTTLGPDPWDLFTGSIAALYYF